MDGAVQTSDVWLPLHAGVPDQQLKAHIEQFFKLLRLRGTSKVSSQLVEWPTLCTARPRKHGAVAPATHPGPMHARRCGPRK